MRSAGRSSAEFVAEFAGALAAPPAAPRTNARPDAATPRATSSAAWVVPPLDVTRSRSSCGGSSMPRASAVAPAKVASASCLPCSALSPISTAAAHHRLDEVEDVGRPRAGQRGDRVEILLARRPRQLRPVGASTASTCGAAARASTAARAYRPEMPWPISAGVFGIARTTRSLPVALRDRVAADAGHHAEVQRIGRRTARARARRRSRNACGLTAQTTSRGVASDGIGRGQRAHAELAASRSRCAAPGSTTTIDRGVAAARGTGRR